MENQTFEGGCTCGHVRFKMTSEPMIVHGCYCRLCQRQTGTSFAQNALIEADRVKLLSGEVEETVVDTPSGAGQKIARCPKCHIAVWSNYLDSAGDDNSGEEIRFIRVGTLDEPDKMPPDIHIYTSTKQPWFILPANTLSVAEGYETKEVWTAESFERLEILFSKDS